MNKACRDIIALNMISGLGPRSIKALLEEVRDTGDVFRMSVSLLNRIAGRRFDGSEKVRSIRDSREYSGELAYIEKEGIHPVCYMDEQYPESLENIYDPPPVLFCKGDLSRNDADAVAIVGSRRCSLYGLQMAERLAFDLAERGITVISGMARGIDSAAHKGALKAGGRTIAVMGSGFRHVYPPEAEKLVPAIFENGAVLTEYPSDTFPHRGNFPRRNRIISGLAKGVVVVEAARKSGAMITVNLALEQGKEVFAVPGRVDLYASNGTNLLIQNGAKLVMSVDDILEELNMLSPTIPDGKTAEEKSPDMREMGEKERGILEMLEKDAPIHIDLLSDRTGMGAETLSEILLRLEIKGFVKTLAGRNYVSIRKGEIEYAR